MKENFVTGTSTYPESPEAVLRILNAYVPPAGWNKRRQEAGVTSEEGAMFAQTGDGGDMYWPNVNRVKVEVLDTLSLLKL